MLPFWGKKIPFLFWSVFFLLATLFLVSQPTQAANGKYYYYYSNSGFTGWSNTDLGGDYVREWYYNYESNPADNAYRDECSVPNWVPVDMFACQKNLGSPNNICCTQPGGNCSSNESGLLPLWGWEYASGCQARQAGGATCEWDYKYGYQACGATDTCRAQPLLYPGLCDQTGCVVSPTVYKTCCDPATGRMDDTCQGGDFTGTCPGGSITVICGVNPSVCAQVAPAPCTPAACGDSACSGPTPPPPVGCDDPPGGGNWRWKTEGLDGYVCTVNQADCDTNACVGVPWRCDPATGNWNITNGSGECATLCDGFCGGPPPPPPPTCPNGSCEAGEDCSSCPADCGSCPPPPRGVCPVMHPFAQIRNVTKGETFPASVRYKGVDYDLTNLGACWDKGGINCGLAIESVAQTTEADPGDILEMRLMTANEKNRDDESGLHSVGVWFLGDRGVHTYPTGLADDEKGTNWCTNDQPDLVTFKDAKIYCVGDVWPGGPCWDGGGALVRWAGEDKKSEPGEPQKWTPGVVSTNWVVATYQVSAEAVSGTVAGITAMVDPLSGIDVNGGQCFWTNNGSFGLGGNPPFWDSSRGGNYRYFRLNSDTFCPETNDQRYETLPLKVTIGKSGGARVDGSDKGVVGDTLSYMETFWGDYRSGNMYISKLVNGNIKTPFPCPVNALNPYNPATGNGLFRSSAGEYFCKLGERSTSPFSGSYQFTESGQYLVTINAYENAGAQFTGQESSECSGNYFIDINKPPERRNQWSDCGPNDNLLVTITIPPPACPSPWLQLSPPPPSSLFQGDPKDLYAVTNPSYGTIDFVRFTSGDMSIVTVNPSWDNTPAYSTLVTAVLSGSLTDEETKITADVYLNDLTGVNDGVKDCWAELEVTVKPVPPWFQVGGGDVHIGGDLYSRIPQNAVPPYFSLDLPDSLHGIVSVGGDTADFLPGEMSQDPQWLATEYSLGFTKENYGFGFFLKEAPTRRELTSLENLDSGFYEVKSGGLVIPGDLTVDGGRKIVIYITDGDLDIQGRINVVPGSFLAFIVKDNINISGSVKAPAGTPAITGIYLADGQITTGASSDQLYAKGIFVAWGGFDLGRTFVSPSIPPQPAERFDYDINLLMNAPADFLPRSFLWQEIAQ